MLADLLEIIACHIRQAQELQRLSGDAPLALSTGSIPRVYNESGLVSNV